ncbi:hypothetical protein OG245_17170 [Streptomyces sp. NBC_01116]|uniref:hypothetical protein n=1 Tax=Streptomyces sp. NBC_01116 TaxID=2903752 RepID=UPI003247C6CE
MNAVAPGATRTATSGAVFDVPGLTEQISGTTALNRQIVDASGGLFRGPRF